MKLLTKIKPEEYKITNHYEFNGICVPRVTEILSAMLHEDGLMGWANWLGFKRQNYNKTLQEAADIGTTVHESIERYINSKVTLSNNYLSDPSKEKIVNGFNSFLSWWDIVSSRNYNVIYQEEPLVCKYFGGTLDLLIEIEGKIYLVDFKTSNHPSYKHFLQMSAYIAMLREERGIKVDGVIILMLSKTENHFTEMLVDLSNPEHFKFINHCECTFMSLVYAYYNRLKTVQLYDNIFKEVK